MHPGHRQTAKFHSPSIVPLIRYYSIWTAHVQNAVCGKVPRPLPGQPGLFLRPCCMHVTLNTCWASIHPVSLARVMTIKPWISSCSCMSRTTHGVENTSGLQTYQSAVCQKVMIAHNTTTTKPVYRKWENFQCSNIFEWPAVQHSL